MPSLTTPPSPTPLHTPVSSASLHLHLRPHAASLRANPGPIALLLAALLALLVAAQPARACSICGCDPSGGTLGIDRPAAGDLRFSLEGRYLAKEAGSADTQEGEKEGRLAARLQYSPVRRLSTSLEVPWYLWKSHYAPNAGGLAEDDKAAGLGDVQLGLRWEVLQVGGMVPDHTLALGLVAKLPTGDNRRLAAVDQGTPDEHKQLGSGSWDFTPGLFYAWSLKPTVLYAALQARINSANARGFRYGNALLGTLGARRSFLETRSLMLSLELQGRNAGYDRDAAGAVADPSSGGFVGYATAMGAYQLTEALVVRATVQLPVVTSLNGAQTEHAVGFVGLAYDLSI